MPGRTSTGPLLTMTAIAPVARPARRDQLTRRIRLLVAATMSYNIIEAVIAVTAGTIASSTALIAFGLDSVIEVSSAAAVAWQFSARDPAVREARERTALRIIAVSFFALATYVTADTVRVLAGDAGAGHSVPGIALTAVSLAVMPVLSVAQRRAGRELGSASAVADSRQTLLCTCLSAVLLAGLLLNAALGWSWADPAAALLIAAAAIREGISAWQGKGCCAASAAAARTPARSETAQAEECGCRPGCQCQAPARSPVCCTMPAVPGHGRLGRAVRLNRSSDRCSAFIASHTLLAQGRDSSVQENGTQQ